MTAERIDLGNSHSLEYIQWAPDRRLNPQWADFPDVERFAAIVYHPRPDTGAECFGQITFDVPPADKLVPDAARWQVQSWEPLTISPSLLCDCGDHGYIRNGRWEGC